MNQTLKEGIKMLYSSRYKLGQETNWGTKADEINNQTGKDSNKMLLEMNASRI